MLASPSRLSLLLASLGFACVMPLSYGHAATSLAPHKATYVMHLASVKNGSRVSDVSGTMNFERHDTCDGWAEQQHMQLHFDYNGGEDLDVTSTELDWESKDGKRYNFNIHHANNGVETDSFNGKARLTGSKHDVRYVIPTKKTGTLAPDTLFPVAHTQMIIDKATAGEQFFTRRVFDGTDAEGSNDVSVFIGKPLTTTDLNFKDTKLSENALLHDKFWPVHIAFFKPDGQSDAPDYEMDMSIMPNGVVQSMRINYGDFTVIGTLTELTPLPSGC